MEVAEITVGDQERSKVRRDLNRELLKSKSHKGLWEFWEFLSEICLLKVLEGQWKSLKAIHPHVFPISMQLLHPHLICWAIQAKPRKTGKANCHGRLLWAVPTALTRFEIQIFAWVFDVDCASGAIYASFQAAWMKKMIGRDRSLTYRPSGPLDRGDWLHILKWIQSRLL
jgi:hypothetical protein